MNPSQFLAALGSRRSLVYHSGLLMADRQHDAAVDALADAAMAAYGKGLCWLFQRRDPAGHCDYLAIRRRP